MATYRFKLINSKVPVIRGRNVIIDSNVGGIKNTYVIHEYLGKIFFIIPIYSYIGTKTFWRPYQKNWNKKEHRVPAPYWGKGPLLNLWLVLSNDYEDPSRVKMLLPESDTTKHCATVLGVLFRSQELNKNLKLNQTFYQSKFEKL